MSKEISNELVEFKSKLSGKISSIKSATTTITDKLSQLVELNNSTKTSVANNYTSSTQVNSATNKIQATVEIVNNMKSDITSTIDNAINGANVILTNIEKLEELKSSISSIESSISSENSKSEPDQSKISSLKSELSTKSHEFDSLNSETTRTLELLKTLDKDLKSNTESGDTISSSTDTNEKKENEETKTNLNDYTQYLNSLKYGQLVRKKFVAKNGTKIDYLLYVPDYGREVTGLPINMYMHGSGMGQNDFSRLTRSGLGRFITDKKLKPSGIVILPLAPSGSAYNSKSFRDALAELPLAVAKEYNANTKKISLSGHSYGAITAYKLVNEHPNEFSAIVPVSGSNKVTSAFKNVNVWAFHGTADNKTKNTSYSQAVSAVKSIIQLGSKAVMHPYKGAGHGGNVVIDTFTKEYEMDGETINPLEWAFKQTRA